MITRLENIQVGKGQYLYKTGRHICGTQRMEPMNRIGIVGACARLVKGKQSEKDNGRVIKHNQKLKETQKVKRDNTHFMCLPQFLSATPLGMVSGTSHDLHVVVRQ